MPETYDIAVIGAGPGGDAAAREAARRGARAVVIERDRPGGTCLNWGCIPTKAFLASAELRHQTQDAAAMGLRGLGLEPDWEGLCARREAIVDRLVMAHEQTWKKAGVECRKATATLLGLENDQFRIGVSGQGEIRARRVILATGSRPGGIPGMEPDGERILNSDQVLKLSVLPMSLLIVGGGVIGCEFASLFADLGCEVTVVEVLPSLLGLADADAAVTRELERLFKKRKYRMHLGCKMESLTATPDGIEARLDNGKIVKSERCLISVGRRLNTGGLGLEAVGLAVQEDAPVPVDAHLATSVPGLYAIGDMTGQVQLAHLATHHGIVAARHALGESGAKIDLDAVPSVVFTRPALAWVGLSEARAAERGLEFVTGQTLARGLGKAHVAGALDGLIKVLADRKTGRVLGVHAIGAGAEDVIAEATLAVRHGLTLRQLVDTIHPHPTMSEGLWEAAAAALASL